MAFLPALALTLALLPQEAPTATAPQAEAPAATPAVQAEGPVPRGAPADDYGLVNWCVGALSGHMQLYPRVRPMLPADGYALDEQQMAAGREYLALYESAVTTADAASPNSRATVAAAARNTGLNVFTGIDQLTPENLKWAYLGWSLPGRCETAARRLLSASELNAPALRATAAAVGPGTTAVPSAPAATSSGGALPTATPPAQPPAAEPAPQ